jgi:inner membrane transporter RhtA
VNRRAAAGAAMIVAASACIQLAAATAHGLFRTLGPTGTSGLRFALAAPIVLAAVRPRIGGRDRGTWLAVGAYGVALAALNVSFFEAIARLPMGIAVTFAFVAPLGVAIAGSRRPRDAGFALLAAAGVAALGGIDPPRSGTGVALAVASGAAWVAVAYAGRSVGRRTRRVDGLALAVPVACLATLPLDAGGLHALDARAVSLGLVVAVVGLIVPFALEIEGLRRLEPPRVAVIYSVDPAIAALVGLVALGQGLTAAQAAGMAAVMAATAGAAGGAVRDRTPRSGCPGAGPRGEGAAVGRLPRGWDGGAVAVMRPGRQSPRCGSGRAPRSVRLRDSAEPRRSPGR